MPFITQGKTNLQYILIVVVLAVIVGGGILGYQYLLVPEEEAKIPEIKSPEAKAPEVKPPEVKTSEEVPPEEFTKDETADWKVYRITKNGFNYTFKYPNDWVINFDPKSIKEDVPNVGFNITYNTLILTSSPAESDVALGYSPFYEQGGTLIYFFKPIEKTFNIDDYPEEYKSTKINDYSAKWIDRAGAAVGEGVTEYSLFHKDKFMLITRSYEEGSKSLHEDTFQKILSTFEFLD